MFSEAERAAFAALLARARANEEISEDEVEAVLPAELADQVIARNIQRGNELWATYDDEVDVGWPVPPPVTAYDNNLAIRKKARSAAPGKIKKLRERIAAELDHIAWLNEQLAVQQSIIDGHQQAAWDDFNKLGEMGRIWPTKGPKSSGWPPELDLDRPPMKLVLPDEQLPVAGAIVRVLGPLLEEEA